MDNPIIESPKIEDEEETAKPENHTETEVVSGSTSIEAPPSIDYEAKKLARDAKAKRKDEKTVQQVLKSLDSLKSPQDKLSAMCKKYSDLLHENRQLQATVKQSEKNINMIHREKEQFRHERSKAVLAKMRLEQLCRELQKLNKAQLEETALKLRVEEEKRKEICFTFQSAFAEMNTLTNQNNEKSAKMREENLEMREKIKSVREGIELTEAQLDKVRQQSRLELELAEKKYLRSTLELTAEKEALKQDKKQLLLKLAEYHVRIKEHEVREQYLTKQIMNSQEKFEELKRDFETTFEFSKNFRPESKEMKKKMLRLEKETALWKLRWEKTNAAVVQMAEIKDKRDAEMITLSNKLSTLQELCKVFQRERASLIAQLRDKNESVQQVDRKALADENRKAMKQFEMISKDCEKLRDNLPKLEGSFSEVMREAFRATSYDDDSNDSAKGNKKMSKKLKNEARKKSNKKKEETSTTNEVKPEKPADSEKPDSPPENGAVACEISDFETALDRNESVFKDIEKILAEQAELQAKIACVKEMKKAIADGDDAECELQPDNNKTVELSKISSEESVVPRVSTFNDEPEVLEIMEILENTEIPSVADVQVKNTGKVSQILEIDGCELDAVTCEPVSTELNGQLEITINEAIEESTSILPSCVDLEPLAIESESEKTELMITEIHSEDDENGVETAEIERVTESSPEDVGSIPIPEKLSSTIDISETTINSPSNKILEIRENVIET